MSLPKRRSHTAWTPASEPGPKPRPARMPPGFTRLSHHWRSWATTCSGWPAASTTATSSACSGSAAAAATEVARCSTARWPWAPICSLTRRCASCMPQAPSRSRRTPRYCSPANSRSRSPRSPSEETPTSARESSRWPPWAMSATRVRSMSSHEEYSSWRMKTGAPRPGTASVRTHACMPSCCDSILDRWPLHCTSSTDLFTASVPLPRPGKSRKNASNAVRRLRPPRMMAERTPESGT
mmetsp:Transcript_25186/g.79386  ORF Transcript_25186/g.79386 Transcript_25186/m.79386 type:complete len:239 (-) Transcript_25186:491-1207(-)